jgi:hypothetical protein
VDLATLDLEIAPELAVSADRTLLDRALEALLACAGREGAAVRVKAEVGAARVEIHVEGAELGPDPFRDPRKGAQGDPRGRSLSLPMARRIAAALGGSLAREGGAMVLTVPGEAPYAAEADEPAAHP